MPRLRVDGLRAVNELDLDYALLLGPLTGGPARAGLRGPDGLTDEQLAVGWQLKRDKIMAQTFAPPLSPGSRPWAFWRFEIGEDRPTDDWRARDVTLRHASIVRLAELGLLTPDELAIFAERANEARIRIGTPRERFSHTTPVDELDVELYAAIRERLP